MFDRYGDEAVARRQRIRFEAEGMNTPGCDGADRRRQLTDEKIENATAAIRGEL